jgi:hypothetical protein
VVVIQFLRAEGRQNDKIHRPMYVVCGEECVLHNSGLPLYVANRWVANNGHSVTDGITLSLIWITMYQSRVLCAWTDRISTAHEIKSYHVYHTIHSQCVPHLMTDTHKELLEYSQQYIVDDMFL